ncbi:MAG: branched-chain amino acid ABC transporter permease, partial [Desulfobacterales bacterium]
MNIPNEFKKSFLTALWFMFLTFPILVIRVNTVENIIQWRWKNMAFAGIAAFFLSFVWRYLIRRR